MRVLTRIVQNQSPTGGWDYNINKESTRDDLSFEGWAIQAIKAGKLAGLAPEGLDECIKKAIRCLKTRNFRNGGFNYTANGKIGFFTVTYKKQIEKINHRFGICRRGTAADYERKFVSPVCGSERYMR